MEKELAENHLKNLEKLANYLEEKIMDSQFNMLNLRSNSGRESTRFISKKKCGTIGCALGWGPFVIPTLKSDFFTDDHELNFARYSKRVFGLETTDTRWYYLFSSSWDFVPKHNTKKAAIKRIRDLVKSKGVLTSSIHTKYYKYLARG